MFPKIERLRLSNFKSFRGNFIIGPFEGLVVLHGSNCLGSLHLIEAIEFVLSIESKNVGVSHAQMAQEFAELTIQMSCRTKIVLKHVITQSEDQEFWINEKNVPKSIYANRLHQLHILDGVPICYDRFSLPQIFQQSSALCTEMFERISGSIEFRHESDRLADLLRAVTHRLEWIDLDISKLHKRHLLMRRQMLDYKMVQAKLDDLKSITCMLGTHICHRNIERSESALQEMAVEMQTKKNAIVQLQADIRSKMDRVIELEDCCESEEVFFGEDQLEKQLEFQVKRLQKFRETYDYFTQKMPTVQMSSLSPNALKELLQSLLSHDSHCVEELQRATKRTIETIHRYNDYTMNCLAHRFNQELTIQSEKHNQINDQLGQKIEEIDRAQQNATETNRQRECFLETSEQLRKHCVGDVGVWVPQESIVADQEKFGTIKKVVQRRMSNRVMVNTYEEAFEVQKRASAAKTYVRIVVSNTGSANGGNGSKLKDVIKLSEPSDEQTTRHFECSLPSLAIAETHKEAQVIARREDVICTDGTIYERNGCITINTTIDQPAVTASKLQALRKNCDFHSPDTCELFPVNEALLHSETIPKFTFDQLHVASSNMHKIIDSYMQNWNAFLNIAEENQRNDLNRNFLAELNAQRNRMESILNTAQVDIDQMKDQITVQNTGDEYNALVEQVKTMKTELTKLNDSIRSVEDRVRTENDRMAEHKVELHALLLSAKESETDIPLLAGSLASLTEAVDSLEGIIIDYAAADLDYNVANIKDVIDRNTEEVNLARLTLEAMKGVQTADVCFAKISTEREMLNQKHEEEFNEYKRLEHEYGRISKKRGDFFMPFFKHMNTYLSGSYVELMANEAARAFLLTPDSCEHPWLEDILLDVIAPGKAYRPKEQLADEEVCMAAVAILFTMRSYGKALPFVVLHAIDDLIKNREVKLLLVEYLDRRSKDRQLIVLSDHKEMHRRADTLIAVLIDDDCHSSIKIMPKNLSNDSE